MKWNMQQNQIKQQQNKSKKRPETNYEVKIGKKIKRKNSETKNTIQKNAGILYFNIINIISI